MKTRQLISLRPGLLAGTKRLGTRWRESARLRETSRWAAVTLLALLVLPPPLPVAAAMRGDERHTQRDDPPDSPQGNAQSNEGDHRFSGRPGNMLGAEVTHRGDGASSNNTTNNASNNASNNDSGNHRDNSPRTWNSDPRGRENSARANDAHVSPYVVRTPANSVNTDTHTERTQSSREEARHYGSHYAVARGDGGRRDSGQRDNQGNRHEHQDETGSRFGQHNNDHHDFDRPARDQRGYAFDNRFNHGRYYPPRGFESSHLSRHAFVGYWNRDPFYFDDGIWYRPFGPRFVVVAPPFGLFVPLLPPYYTTIWVGGFPYFYADDVYYRWYPERHGYVVSEPPNESEVRARPTVGDDVFMYPKNKQSDAQQATDRYECHRWAVDQTGFDPTLPLGGVSANNSQSKREDYRRAMSACLEGRGYSVK